MSPHQEIALQHPCFLACETAHPRFAHDLKVASLVLTVNSGYE